MSKNTSKRSGLCGAGSCLARSTFSRQILPYHSSATLTDKFIDHSLDENRNQRDRMIASETSRPTRRKHRGMQR